MLRVDRGGGGEGGAAGMGRVPNSSSGEGVVQEVGGQRAGLCISPTRSGGPGPAPRLSLPPPLTVPLPHLSCPRSCSVSAQTPTLSQGGSRWCPRGVPCGGRGCSDSRCCGGGGRGGGSLKGRRVRVPYGPADAWTTGWDRALGRGSGAGPGAAWLAVRSSHWIPKPSPSAPPQLWQELEALPVDALPAHLHRQGAGLKLAELLVPSGTFHHPGLVQAGRTCAPET